MALSPRRVAASVFGAVTQTIVMDCEASASVNDLVRQDQALDNKVEVATNNLLSYQIIGIISKKLTATSCEVILRGVIDYSGIARGRVYLSPAGIFTVSAPTTNYLQILGYSFGNDKIHFEPNTITTFLGA